MKKISLKWIRNIVAISLAAVFCLSFGIMFAVSYAQYRDYYEKMLGIKDEIDNKPPVDSNTHMTGITLTAADGVRYFDNGKAVPTKADFIVEGKYKIAEREFTETIPAGEYTLSVPADFVTNGGTVTASYVYREPVKTDATIVEPDEPQYNETTFTAELDFDLEAVKLERIEVVENPYLVYYKAGDAFDPRGMVVKGYNNDGSIDESVDMSTVHVDSGALAAGDAKATFSFGNGDDRVAGDIAITVVPVDEFDNGALEELLVDGEMELEEGATVDAGQMNVLARYTSGNRILLDKSEYRATGSTEGGSVHFGGKYTFKVEYEVNPDIFTYVRVKVKKAVGADAAVVTGAAVDGGAIKDIGAGDTAVFTYESVEASYVDLYVNVSNGNISLDGNTYVASEHDLKKVMTLAVNGKLYYLPELVLDGGTYETADEAYTKYSRVYLGKYWFKVGQNTVKLTFKADRSGAENFDGGVPIGRVKSVEALSFDDSRVVNSIGEYVEACAETSTVQSYTTAQSRTWGDFDCNSGWVYSACTDNTYIYYYGRVPNGSQARIIKYNPTNDTIVGYSAQFGFSSEANAVTIYKGGYVYTTDSQGKFLRVATADIDTSGAAALETLTDTKEIPLDLGGSTNGMYYNPQKRMYAVLFTDKISVYDFVGEHLRDIEIPSSVSAVKADGGGTTATVARITGNGRFIYVMYKTNSVISPVIRIYSFDGEFIGQTAMPNTLDIMGKPEGFWTTNAQSIVDMNGDVYFSLLEWNPNTTSVYKVSFNYEFVGTAEKDLGSYFESCTEAGVAMKYASTPVRDSVLDKLKRYPHGICTDGTYAYVSSSEAVGEYGDGSVSVAKISLENGETLGTTKVAYTRGSAFSNANAEYLYYRDGKIFMPCLDNKVRYFLVTDIAGEDSAEWHELEVTSAVGESTVNSFTFNEALEKYAVVTRDNKLHIVTDGTFVTEKSFALGGKPTGIYSDANYIYALSEGGASEAKIAIYDWHGNAVGTASLPGLCSAASNNNVQSMFVLDDEIYFLICQWGGTTGWTTGGILVKVTLDYSVL